MAFLTAKERKFSATRKETEVNSRMSPLQLFARAEGSLTYAGENLCTRESLNISADELSPRIPLEETARVRPPS